MLTNGNNGFDAPEDCKVDSGADEASAPKAWKRPTASRRGGAPNCQNPHRGTLPVWAPMAFVDQLSPTANLGGGAGDAGCPDRMMRHMLQAMTIITFLIAFLKGVKRPVGIPFRARRIMTPGVPRER